MTRPSHGVTALAPIQGGTEHRIMWCNVSGQPSHQMAEGVRPNGEMAAGGRCGGSGWTHLRFQNTAVGPVSGSIYKSSAGAPSRDIT